MRSRQLVLVSVLFEMIAVPLAAGAPSSGIYWSHPGPTIDSAGSIWRADFDGSNIQAIVTQGLNAPWPVVADVSTHKIYWGDVNRERIQRANLDGTSMETIVSGPISFIDNPAGIAVDSDNQQLYWTDFVIDKIARTDLVTHTTVTLVTGEKRIPLGIDLDLDAGQMYWVDASTSKLRRAQLDGTSVQDVLTGLNNPRDVKIDVEQGMVYWAELSAGIWRADLNGTNVEHLVFQGQNNLFLFFALDRLERKLYWKAYVGLVRTDLDGANLEVVIPNTHESVRGDVVHGIAIVHDCNDNMIDDYDELSYNDCNGNRNPDDCDPDADGDGVTDDCDNCPQTPNADQLDCNSNTLGNACEPNPADADDDSDGVCNGADGCPLDPEKTEPGICGCGVSDADSDGDGVADCDDLCPGSADVDSDGDSVLDCDDLCPGAPDIDSDGDSVLDCNDRCPGAPDVDSDGDTVLDCADVCPGEDDRIDDNANGIPDCLEPTIIPAVSHWGLIILTLLLLVAAKTRFKRLA